MKRLELSEANMRLVRNAVQYYWNCLCVHGNEATEAVEMSMNQPYTVDNYIQIWKLHNFMLGMKSLTLKDVKRIRRLYGKRWRGEEDWQSWSRDQKKKFRAWEDAQIK